MTDFHWDESKIFEKKNQNGRLKKTKFFNDHQFSIFFQQNLGIGHWVSRINWCEGHQFCLTYMVVMFSNISSKIKKTSETGWEFKLAITKTCPLIFFNKFVFWKIRIIFDIKNWLWKSDIGIFRSHNLECTLIYQNFFLMKKCYFPPI